MCYSGATGGAVTLQDEAAVADTVFTQQNSHFIFTDPLLLLGAACLGATITQGQIYSPTLVSYGLLNLWPLNRSLTPPSYPRVIDFRNNPFQLPMNEQIQFLASDTASETVTGHMWVAPTGWNRNQLRGMQHSLLKLTSSIALTTGTWTGVNALTFQNIPKGGWYVVTGAWCFDANARAYRLYFPRSPGVSGRQLRPGGLVSHARGDLVAPGWDNDLGNWGAFHTFEPVQMEMFGDTAGASTQELYLDVWYLGQGDSGAYPAGI